MGACATKPAELKEEGEAPLPLEEAPAEVDAETKQEDKKPTSLGNLFKESEESEETSENEEEITVREPVITTEQEETEGEKEEETKAQVQPAQDSGTTKTAETEEDGSAPANEEASLAASAAQVAEALTTEGRAAEMESVKEISEDATADDNGVEEIKATVVEEKAEAMVEASSSSVPDKDDGANAA